VNRPYDVITFDCYGTLIDWERGIADAFTGEFGAEQSFDLGAVLAAYHEIEPVVESETYRSYREVLTETVRRLVRRHGWALTEARAGFLAESLPSWPPFADTNAALRRLAAAGYGLGILSNVDDDLLAGTRRHLVGDFAFVVTAQQVRSYKPAPGHFLAARARIGGARWLHAAQSYFHDVVPARALAIPVAWINRKHQAPTGAAGPDQEFSTLRDLADWLT
jgi:2-haloalkanoic acid dehalogenase type II